MAREYAKLLTRIWADRDFKALRAVDQRLYFQLISQPDISMCGLVTLAEKRWSLQVADQDDDNITSALDALESSRFVVVDRGTQEVLVRSYVRSDEAWKSPTTMKGIDSSIRAVLSDGLKAVLRDELMRVDTSKLSAKVSEKTGQSTRDYVEGIIRGIAEDYKGASHAPTDTPSHGASDTPTQGHKRNLHTTEPEPEPATTPEPAPAPETPSTSEIASDPEPDDEPEPEPRDDIEGLLDLLDLEIQRNGNRTPGRNKTNYDAMRLLLDRDKASEEQIAYVIRWCQNDNFWKAVILSPSNLREKFARLVAQIKSEQERQNRTTPNKAEQRIDGHLDIVARFAEREESIQGELL